MVLKLGRWAVIAPLVVLLAGACSGGKDGEAAVPTSTTSVRASTTAPRSTTVEDESGAVAAGYEAASRAFIEAAAIPDPDAPALEATHVGPMFDQRRTTLLGLKAEGKVIRYPTPSAFRVNVGSVVVEGDIARLEFCAVDDGERVDASTGETLSHGVVTVRGKAALRRVGDAWKLAEQSFDSRSEGSASCG